MNAFRRVMNFFLQRKKLRRETIPTEANLREIEKNLAQNQRMIEQTQKLLLAEAQKIGRLRQIEIDLEKLIEAGDTNEKNIKRLKGTKRALELANQRFDKISEQLGKYDHYGTVLLVQRSKTRRY